MLHLRLVRKDGEIVDELQGDFDTMDNNQMTIKGLRDFLNAFIDEGYGDYGALFGYDTNYAFTYPSKCIKISDKDIRFLE